jgi:acetate kinase
MSRILCMNAGSSSLKFALYEEEQRALAGSVENIGIAGGRLRIGKEIANCNVGDHGAAAAALLDQLREPPDAIGHRLVHGGPRYFDPVLLTETVFGELHALIPYAPLHLPGALAVIEAVSYRFPQRPQVLCFDTAFHRSICAEARYFPLPRELRQQGVIRYGFHGLAFESLVSQLADSLPPRLVAAHLGNGVSLAAIRDGKCLDTTMGFTPTGGVMMGTRSGDLDPGVLIYLLRHQGYDADRLSHLVNDEAGLLGVSGISSDMKVLLGREEGAEAISMFCYQVKKTIAAMSAVLGGVDMVAFTGGIGERAPVIRKKICEGLDYLGIGEIRVVETDEDLVIARHTAGTLR